MKSAFNHNICTMKSAFNLIFCTLQSANLEIKSVSRNISTQISLPYN